jgi:probable HAF family extracellular repeat protein
MPASNTIRSKPFQFVPIAPYFGGRHPHIAFHRPKTQNLCGCFHMLLSSKLRKLSTSSGLAAVFSFLATSITFAAPSFGPLGLSSDGSTFLEYAIDASTGNHVYQLTDVATGSHFILADNPNFPGFHPIALSADGGSVTGTYAGSNGLQASFVWTKSGGFQDLGSVGGARTTANAVSADGSVIVGEGSLNGGTDLQAFYWTSATGIVTLPQIGTGNLSSAKAVSADGHTIAGEANMTTSLSSNPGLKHAFVWTSGTGMHDIDTIYDNSVASLVNKDGSVIAGTGSLAGTTTVFRWTSAGMIDVGNLGGTSATLKAMSDDGSTLVGSADLPSQYTGAFRYNASTGLIQELGTLGGHSASANDVNADGSVVVGTSADATSTFHGFRWTAATGMQSVEDWLASEGLNLGGETTASADFVSAKGNVIVGTTPDDTTYIARVVSPDDTSGGGTGIIDTSKFLPTVAAANNVAVQYGIYNADTIMFGAQGEPMRNLLSTGQRSAWGTVDGGYENGDHSKGGLALGEFGFGYGIVDGVTARVAAGGTYTKQELDVSGDVRQRGFYLSPEVSADVGHNLYLTVGGYWGRGSIDSHRGYLNGVDHDYSDGSTNSETWGAKIRLDWLNAATIDNTAITPYAALSYAHTKVDAFTEDSGSFPVSYDATDDHATIARLGTDFVHPLTDKVRILAKAEADYQFGDRAADTRGTIVGISDFDLPGQDLNRFWVRGGLGAEFDAGKGTASVMMNATTQGQDPTFWVRTNYTVKF